MKEHLRILHAILSSLGPYEQRAVKAEFEEKKFHFDIIGSQNVQLPVEIILQITALLDLLDVVRSQRVSRSWQEVLTSWVVMDQAMEQWYDKSDPPLTCDRIPFDPAYTRKQKLDHIRRIRTCSPSAQASVEIPHHSDLRLLTTPNTQSDHVIFHDEVLAWRSTDTSKLMLLNVKKGINSFGCTQGREGIEEIFLTSRYAICSSLHGRLSAFDIARMDKDSLFLPVHASIRLPSISRRIRAVDDIVAILHTESLHNLDASYNVQIWNISENKSWSFRRSARDSKKSEVDIIPDK
ncbi:hypothetical protein EJ08DRAFT_293642 [Tothia fuscella]|uniref:F-box domain-containing protein n=1 Tax=Tothia fuscella TaxID=1048955 RepID=A0A9P4P254_9PEZI|nr:hypothetical protein EJ08DRAFT_293642 [Tothia fuscella]